MKKSLVALQTVYKQITLHPDNESYRKIRRNHPQYVHDIGQYPGGNELLIVSGFTISMIDETISSFICIEPNVEHDLDRWSQWYDLLKYTVQQIELELSKLK